MVNITSNKWQEISLNYEKERETCSIPALVSDNFVTNLIKKSDKNILDFWAWIGTISKKIVRKWSHKVYVYEPNIYMSELLKKNIMIEKEHDNIFIIDKFNEIKNIKVDAIVCNNVLDHIEKIEPIIAFFHRILNRQWHLILSIPHPLKNAGNREKNKKWETFSYDFYKIENYMNEGVVSRNREDVYGKVIAKNVNSFNRRLETYFNILIAKWFSIRGLYEPWLAKKNGKKFPIIYAKASRIPYFLILDCYKNDGGENK